MKVIQHFKKKLSKKSSIRTVPDSADLKNANLLCKEILNSEEEDLKNMHFQFLYFTDHEDGPYKNVTLVDITRNSFWKSIYE